MNKKYYMYIILYFYTITKATAILKYSSGFILEKDILASSASLSNTSSIISESIHSVKRNPAQINSIKKFETSLGYDYSAFGEQDTELLLGGRIYNIPFLLNIGTQIPFSFDHISDEGNLLKKYYLYEFYIGLSNGYNFNIKNQEIHLGYTIKWYQEKFLNEDLYSIVGDLGLVLPFKLPYLQFLPNTLNRNFSISLSAINFGKTLNKNSSYNYLIQKNLYLPSSLLYSLLFIPVSIKNYSIELATSLKLYPFDPNIKSTLEYTQGLRFIFFDIVYLRGSINKNFYFWDLNIGVGIEYTFSYIFSLQINYNFKPISSFGKTHQADIKFSFNYSGIKERMEIHKEKYTELENNLNKDIVSILNNCIKLYKLSYGHYPKHLDDLLDILYKNYKLTSIPNTTEGFLEYDSYLGTVVLKTKSPYSEYEDVIYFKDKSRILAKVINSWEDSILIKTEFGEKIILRSNISKIMNIKIDLLNSEALKIIQYYINQYKVEYNQYPVSIEILKEFLLTKLIPSLPQITDGVLEYNGELGVATIHY